MRDPERQPKLENKFSIFYPDFPSFDLNPYEIEFVQARGKHDILIAHYLDTIPFFLEALSTGTPVEVTWKNDKVSEKFVGYKTETYFATSPLGKRRTSIQFVGPSFVLKESKPEIWVNKTATEIVSDIAKKFKLKPMVTPNSLRFSQVTLAGNSYWEKINELADRIGYAVQMKGIELHFHPIDKMIDQFLTTIPIMSTKDYGSDYDSVYLGRTLEFFEPTIGDFLENKPHRRTEKTVQGVDPVTAKVFSSVQSPNKVGKKLKKKTKDPLFSQFESRTVVASSEFATAMSTAKAQHSRFSIFARGGGQGDPRIAPWRTVEVRNTEDASDGFWIVDSVVHTMKRNYTYTVEFTCVTDGIGREGLTDALSTPTGSVPVRNITSELSSATNPKPTTPILKTPVPLIDPSNSGYKLTPSRWEAR